MGCMQSESRFSRSSREKRNNLTTTVNGRKAFFNNNIIESSDDFLSFSVSQRFLSNGRQTIIESVQLKK